MTTIFLNTYAKEIPLNPPYSGCHMSKPQIFYRVLIGTTPYEIVWLTELKTAVKRGTLIIFLPPFLRGAGGITPDLDLRKFYLSNL
jgi:hypothetical protein